MTDRFIDEYEQAGCPGVHCLPVPQTNGDVRVVRYFKEDWWGAAMHLAWLYRHGFVSAEKRYWATRCIMDLAARDGVLERIDHKGSWLDAVKNLFAWGAK